MLSERYGKIVKDHFHKYPVIIKDIPFLQSSFEATPIDQGFIYELAYIEGNTLSELLGRLCQSSKTDEAVVLMNSFLSWYKNNFVYCIGNETLMLCGDSNLANIIYHQESFVHIDLVEDFLCVTSHQERPYLPIYLSLIKSTHITNDFIDKLDWPFAIELLKEYEDLDLDKISDLNDFMITTNRQKFYDDLLNGTMSKTSALYQFIHGDNESFGSFYHQYLSPFLRNDFSNLNS
tara:strand:+ start:63782 stop:64483 length:702 start_codon:yes stop_codon:yes gene_type:complete